MKSKILLSALSILFSTLMWAQNERITRYDASNYRNWSFGLTGGTNYTMGDAPNLFFNDNDAFPDEAGGITYGFRGNLTKFFTPTVGMRISAGVHRIEGRGSNTYFQGFNSSGDVSVMVNLSNMFLKGKTHDRKNAFLMGAGIGISFISNTIRDINGNAISVFGNDNSGLFDEYAEINSIPLTLNYKRRLSQKFDFDVLYRHEVIFTDDLDGIPTPSSNDGMAYLGVGVTYHFKNKSLENPDSVGHVMYTNPLDDMVAVVDKAREDFEKLSKDDDGDGVSNFYDKDNATPEGTVVDGAGRPIDSDMDGVPDYMDEDPFSAKGAKVDANGRAVDSDGDGVPDHMDQEANTPQGALVNFQGKEIKVNGGGNLASGYLPSVFFGFNSATVTTANHQRLAAVARTLKANSGVKVKVVGYTDKTGTEEYNRKLGERRAQAVVDQLVKVYGIDSSRFTVASEGEANPLATRRDVNRRADIIPQ